MSFAASVTVALDWIVITGLDIESATVTLEGKRFLAAILWTMSRSVTIPTVSPFLPETRTQPMLCLAISLATSAAVSDSFTVMTGRDMMSLTTTSSGSVSCTDKGSNRSDPTCIKSSCESEAVLRQNVISTQTVATLPSLVERGVQPSGSDFEGGQAESFRSASYLDCLLATSRLRRPRGGCLQHSRIWTRRGNSRNSCSDQCWNRRICCLGDTCQEYSRLWNRRFEGAEQACHSRNGFLYHLDDFHDDSAKYCVKPSSFLASSVFSPSSGGVAGLGGPPVFSADRTVT